MCETNREPNNILFLVEGEIIDTALVRDMANNFLDENSIIIPHRTNIYNLYKRINDGDGFEDVFSILQEDDTKKVLPESRDDITSIYLLFDFDAHHLYNNVGGKEKVVQVIKKMLEIFDNETENGKLYLSYPMVESIHHFCAEKMMEGVYEKKIIKCSNSKHGTRKRRYKEISRSKDYYPDIRDLRRYGCGEWDYIITQFLWACHCLFNEDGYLDYTCFIEECSQINIFSNQYKYYIKPEDNVVVLSAFPSLILEYFGEKLYDEQKIFLEFYSEIKMIDYH